MSLMEYNVFINSLIVTLQLSGNCCSIYKTPSTPVGYADDLIACTLSKYKMDRTHDTVYAHGNTWLYSFNAKKSGILVYRENQMTNKIACNRIFKLC